MNSSGRAMTHADDADYIIRADRNYTAAEVARYVLRVSPDTFRRVRQALYREGFPRPVSSTFLAPWHGADLLDWMRRDKSTVTLNSVIDFTDVLAARARKVASK